MEGLFSLGNAFLSHVEWPWIALTTPFKLIIASDQEEIQDAADEDEVLLIKLLHEPGTRQDQLGQAVVEGIADELFDSGDTIVALYAGYDSENVDTLSVIPLGEQLSPLTARDLQRRR